MDQRVLHGPPRGRRSDVRHRLTIASRIVAATLGGYALANAAAIALGSILPGNRADVVFALVLSSFGVYAAAILWAFAARTATRAWIGMLMVLATSLALVAVAATIGTGAPG